MGQKNENKQEVFHSMKVIYEKVIEVNNKLIVNEQQDDIKH